MSKPCAHDGFHEIRSTYDRSRAILFFFWTCEDCGEQLGEAERADYRPQFEARGNDAYLDAAR
jgi:hypothetical protein